MLILLFGNILKQGGQASIERSQLDRTFCPFCGLNFLVHAHDWCWWGEGWGWGTIGETGAVRVQEWPGARRYDINRAARCRRRSRSRPVPSDGRSDCGALGDGTEGQISCPDYYPTTASLRRRGTVARPWPAQMYAAEVTTQGLLQLHVLARASPSRARSVTAFNNIADQWIQLQN